jgi:hypothetical protein
MRTDVPTPCNMLKRTQPSSSPLRATSIIEPKMLRFNLDPNNRCNVASIIRPDVGDDEIVLLVMVSMDTCKSLEKCERPDTLFHVRTTMVHM